MYPFKCSRPTTNALMRTTSEKVNPRPFENGFDVAEAEVGLLLDRCGDVVLRRDAELAGTYQDAAARRNFHPVAVAGKRRPNAGRSDMLHGGSILTSFSGR